MRLSSHSTRKYNRKRSFVHVLHSTGSEIFPSGFLLPVSIDSAFWSLLIWHFQMLFQKYGILHKFNLCIYTNQTYYSWKSMAFFEYRILLNFCLDFSSWIYKNKSDTFFSIIIKTKIFKLIQRIRLIFVFFLFLNGMHK